jgi:hypothetical protein
MLRREARAAYYGDTFYYSCLSLVSSATIRSLSSMTKVARRLNIGSSPSDLDWEGRGGFWVLGGGSGFTRVGGRDSNPVSLDTWDSIRLSCALSWKFSASNREMRDSRPSDADTGVKLLCSSTSSTRVKKIPTTRTALSILLSGSG